MSHANSPQNARPESQTDGDTLAEKTAAAPSEDATLGGSFSRVEDGFAAVPTSPRVLASDDDATLAERAPLSIDSRNEEPSLLENGAEIGPYEVQSHLGDGGMASVYRVWHLGLHRVEALKVPRQQGRFGPEAAFLRRLLAEARTVANLQHPNIAAIYAISDAASPLQYFSMEFIEGGDLAAFLAERGQISPSVALPILEQVASALDYAHAQNVIHRDIKPANILLQYSSEDIKAKVVDFGISRANEEAGGTRLTRSGMIVGTPEYMSPEQSGSGDDVTHLTDEYSLGVLAYEMLCGAPPFVAGEGVSRLSLLMKHVGESPETPARRVSGLPAAASDAIIKALSKKPEARFDSCSEFIAALRKALAGHDGIAAHPTLSVFGAARDAGTRVFPSAENTLEIAAPPAQKARMSTMLAGVGGLLAGVALVFGWLGYGATETTSSPPAPMAIAVTPTPSAPTTSAPTATATANTAREYSPSRVVTQREIVPFRKMTRENAALSKGSKRVVQKGRSGTREVRLQISTRDGVQDVRRGTTRMMVAPRDEISEIGTKETVVAAPATPPKSASTRASNKAARDAKSSQEASPRRVRVKRAREATPRRIVVVRRAVTPRRAKSETRIQPRRRVARSSAESSARRVRRTVRASTRVPRRTVRVRSTRPSPPTKRVARRSSSGGFRGVEAALPP